MTRVPPHMSGLSPEMAAAIAAQAAADHQADPGPPLSKSTLEGLRVLLRRAVKRSKDAA